MSHADPAASIIIPAYNEAAVLPRCLRALEPSLGADARLPVEVIVVPNGCTDDTAQIAHRAAAHYSRVRVVEMAQGSKTAALNAGDDAASAFPRIYLDADIELSPGALPALIEALDTPHARVAAPRIRFETTHADPLVRSFYRTFAQLPYVTDGLIGLGVYGVSAAGRARFGRFPDIVADDLMIQRLFAADERVIVAGEFVVRVPRDVAGLVRVRARVARGNTELGRSDDQRFAASTGSTAGALARTLRGGPRAAADAACYAAVTMAARTLAWTSTRRPGRAGAWERDESTRTPVSGRVARTGRVGRRTRS